ncbi:Stk1 family PASTA domain-containing Ser/Thr kinase [Intestinimonas timonensis]|uniref:Stk1 family PASTA domain-containing Ser/Thr kinase n=1 Tax=Intestinimonas timonensis TaxID=1689270 RepID=UPI0010314B29|nr:Stk1 family PASTA domain-containing Ser/Thr kinase [Intestinimonas timonensis]
MDQYIGKLLDNRYEILERIGTGGMAVVFKGRDHRLNRLVAIKILKDDLAKDAEFRRRFHDESQAVAMLSHPNIMAVYDVSRSEQVEYIVMELIDGITLKQYMQRKGGPLSWKESLHFITQIMKALSHAHGRGIIHRDIKPQNIMVLRDGSIKVTDFGIARLASAAQSTLTQEALGSVHYISPEQARGSRIDGRSDIYSAGVVLYEMLTGRLPFEGDTPVSVAIQHINSIPLAPRELNPDIPEALEAITMKAMAPKVENRYRNADDMLYDLEEFRKDPSIDLEYDPAKLFATPDVADEPTQVIGTGSRRRSSDTGSMRRRSREEAERGERVSSSERPRNRQKANMSVPLAVASILVFIIGIGVLLWVVFFSNSFQSDDRHTVPNLYGMTVEEAMADPKVQGIFEIVEGGSVSSSLEPGKIVSQDPEAKQQVTGEDLTITVTTSAGEEPIYMPDLVNKDYLEAQQALLDLGISKANITMTYETSDEITENYVIRTVPLADSAIQPDTVVEIIVSQGPKVVQRTMLSVDGMTLDKARELLEGENGLGLVVKAVYIDSDEPKDTVLIQSIPTGTQVNEGETVTLQVSSGSSTSSGENNTESPATETPVPSESPAPSSDPDVKTVQHSVTLPDGDPDEIVTVQVRGSGYDQSKQVPLVVQSVVFNITGKGKQKFDIYINGERDYSIEVDFDTGDVKLG